MRLAVVSSYFPVEGQPHRGQSSYQTLLRMRDHFDIEVFCPLQRYPSWMPPRHFSYSRANLRYQPEGLRTSYFEYPALPGLSRPVNGPVVARLLRPHLARFRPDLILNYWLYPDGWAAVTEGRRLGVPVVLGAIGSDLNRIPDRISLWYTRRALRKASFLLTVSDHLRQRGIALGMPEQRTRTVKNGCDTALFHPRDRLLCRTRLNVPARARLVVFVGLLAETKGLRELMSALVELAPQHPDLQLACIGSGPLKAEMEQRAATAGLASRLLLPGQQSSAQVAEWLGAADLFCLPSYMEGCPNVVVEALASGRPVLATRVGGIPELVDTPGKGVLFEPRSASALAAALHAALARPWPDEVIAAACRRDWADAARDTLEICDAALRLSPTRAGGGVV